uniref:Reverse transcriptase domain-containing protein n=1 Tax=Plectus sambesii TaxID=2011161 RepID=A0A914W866_9BILA
MVSSNLYIDTYNIHSYQVHADKLQIEAKIIKYDFISLTEVRKCSIGRVDLKNGTSLYYLGHADKAKDGVGFFINQLQKQQVHGFIATSPRIAQLLLQIWNSNRLLQLIQVYAPATSAKDPSDTTYNAFLNNLTSTLTTRIDRRVEQMIILSDLNAKTQLAANPCNKADADSLYAKLVDNVNAATTIATFQEPQPTPLSDEILALLRQRREWKHEAGRASRAGQMQIEYVELCKTIHKKVKEDRRKHHIQIIKQAVQDGVNSLVAILIWLVNLCLHQRTIPTGFADARTILLYKKGDAEDIKNYHPISLLLTIYKTFTRILTERIRVILDTAKTDKQAGFRRTFSTIDHIHIINKPIQKVTEYRLPLYMAFVNYEKVFNLVENCYVW